MAMVRAPAAIAGDSRRGIFNRDALSDVDSQGASCHDVGVWVRFALRNHVPRDHGVKCSVWRGVNKGLGNWCVGHGDQCARDALVTNPGESRPRGRARGHAGRCEWTRW